MHIKTSNKDVFLLNTSIFLLSCRLFYLFLVTVGNRVQTTTSPERITHFFLFLSLSLSLSPLSFLVLAFSSPFMTNPPLSSFTISLHHVFLQDN
jgi:hypothetical protein